MAQFLRVTLLSTEDRANANSDTLLFPKDRTIVETDPAIYKRM